MTQPRHKLPFNPYMKYLGRSITVLTYSKRRVVIRPMSIATDRDGRQWLIGPGLENETSRIATDDILSVWQRKF